MTAVPAAPSTAAETPGTRRLVHRVLQADPAQEYLIYVPSSPRPDPPVVVSVHGVSRNADEHALLLSAYCEVYGAILAVPSFSVELHPDYQRLGRLGRGKRADVALGLIVSEVAEATGASAERFHLFGFSGGAQFAHRYAMAHPHRVASVVAASAGWYTLPDPTRRFPYGTRASRELPGVRFDAEEFLQVPMQVLIGTRDDHGRVRHTPRLDREQGSTRLERARRFVAAMHEAAASHQLEPRVTLEEIERGGHSFRRSVLRNGLGERAFRAMLGEAPPGGSAER